MIRRFIALFVPVALVALTLGFVAGCSVDTELGGTKVPNSRPDTRLTGQPPTLLEAGFAVTFNWTGYDPDGTIVGYQWKISDNGIDGISPRDTLTTDPLTGAVINPWNFTSANDSTFLVLADQADFPGDDGSASPRSFRSHTLFIRAMDDVGAVDQSPALMSFTSTTIVPTSRIFPETFSNQGFKTVPPTVNLGWSGTDVDFDLRVPTRARFLWKSAKLANGNSIRTPTEYNLNFSEILNFDDPEWSEWLPYAAEQADRLVSFQNRPDGEYFLFATQTQDTAGAVSVSLGYQVEVAHVKILKGFYKPVVTVLDPFLGATTSSEKSDEIASGQPLNFSWIASAEGYNGNIISYRHGWDLLSVDDPNDQGWAVPPGLSTSNLFAVERSFQEGLHTFTVRVEDDSGQIRIMTWTLRVVPYVDPVFQQNIMVLDQVVDRNVGNWPDQSGAPRNDESYRNPWWHFLADGAGGVSDINWERDWFDHTDNVQYSDMVKYKVVLCYAQTGDNQQMMRQFRPINDVDRFVWLTPYQERGGNLFLVGGGSMESFLEVHSENYMVPIVFDTREETLVVNGNAFLTGFGQRELPDGTRIDRGPLQYPYATAGISAIDWTSPNTKNIYNRPNTVRFDRTVDCVGLKGLVLDEEFADFHLIGPGVIADTMWTDPVIDWHDVVDAAADTMKLFHLTFPFRNDEFVNSNISTRSTPIIQQSCPEDGPGGLCVQPMFQGIARFDYMREYFRSRGETTWPDSRYDAFALDDGCGSLALTTYEDPNFENALTNRGSALTNGQTFGYFSYKMVENKPVQKADVYWGFDPYRFDHDESRKAIRWVLQYFGLQINQ
ncbi:MAG: hypothetical protein ACI9UK_001123 [Candidatus Krumholzibacteriia bacterium]|jgi:hypothetical protein